MHQTGAPALGRLSQASPVAGSERRGYQAYRLAGKRIRRRPRAGSDGPKGKISPEKHNNWFRKNYCSFDVWVLVTGVRVYRKYMPRNEYYEKNTLNG